MRRLRASAAALAARSCRSTTTRCAAWIDDTMAAASRLPDRGSMRRGLHPHPADARRRRAELRPRRHARAVARHHRQAASTSRQRACFDEGITISLVPILRNHPGSVNPIIKSNNLLNNAMAMQEAHRRGAEEALMCNYRGELSECSQSNFFLVRDGVALTPRSAAGLLEGLRAAFCSRSAATSASRSRKRRCVPEDLRHAQEAFITGTTRELTPVVRIDDRAIGTGRPGPVTLQAAATGSERRPWLHR